MTKMVSKAKSGHMAGLSVGAMPMNVKSAAAVLTWIAAVISTLFWLGIIEPLGSRLARETEAVHAQINKIDGRVESSERSIIDLQYGIKSIENVQVQLTSISARLAAIELRLAQQSGATLKP
jgi:hypothetical protein